MSGKENNRRAVTTKVLGHNFICQPSKNRDAAPLETPPEPFPVENAPSSWGETENMGYCFGCRLLLMSVELKDCSRCGVAQYCSKDCQRKDWCLHKKCCKPKVPVVSDSRIQSTFFHLHKILSENQQKRLLDVLLVQEGSAPQMNRQTDIELVASTQRKQKGPGCIVMHFRCFGEMELLITSLLSALQGKQHSLPLIRLEYKTWPYQGDDALVRCLRQSVNDVNELNMWNRFCACFHIKKEGLAQVGHMLLPEFFDFICSDKVREEVSRKTKEILRKRDDDQDTEGAV